MKQEQKWYQKQELKGVSFNCASRKLSIDILANDTIKGLWYFTLDERKHDALYFGPYRTKEQADNAAYSYNPDHWKKRLWYL